MSLQKAVDAVHNSSKVLILITNVAAAASQLKSFVASYEAAAAGHDGFALTVSERNPVVCPWSCCSPCPWRSNLQWWGEKWWDRWVS